METLIDDIIITIMKFLNDNEKIRFLSLSNNLHNMKNKVHYDEIINIDVIHELSYYDMFTNVRVCKSHFKNRTILPNSITHLTFESDVNKDINNYLPDTITHLTFGNDFNQDIKGCIPNSVTHLTFGWCFNQDIKDCIPDSVTHLILDAYFDHDIKSCIPDSVIYLQMNEYYGNYHKKRKDEFDEYIKCIPHNTLQLWFSNPDMGYGMYFHNDKIESKIKWMDEPNNPYAKENMILQTYCCLSYQIKIKYI